MKPAASKNGFGKALLLVGALTALFCGACADPEGRTPECTQDVTADGHQNIDNGCNKFARCEKDPSNPMECCKDIANDFERCACMYGYGDVDALKTCGGGV